MAKIKKELDSLKPNEILELKKETKSFVFDGELKIVSAGNTGNFSKLTAIQLWADSVILFAGTITYKYKLTYGADKFLLTPDGYLVITYTVKPASTSKLEIKQEAKYIIFTYSYSGKTFIYKYEYVAWQDL